MKKALIVIDMQNDFIDGSLGTPEAKAIVLAVTEKVKAAVQDGEKLVFTQDTHHSDYLKTAEGEKAQKREKTQGSGGAEAGGRGQAQTTAQLHKRGDI